MENEIWKDIPGYEGEYQVSNMGRVKSTVFYKGTKERLLTLSERKLPHKKGYLRVRLGRRPSRDCISVHRLVMEVFVGKSNKQVNHINEDKQDNRLENLEYCTNRENTSMYHSTKRDLPTGVYARKNSTGIRYFCNAWVNGGMKTFGTYDTIEEAVKARAAGMIGVV